MFFLASWGKDANQIGYLGIRKCGNCLNYSQFNLYEYSQVIKMFFVKISERDRKRYLVCSVCGCGYELNEVEYSEMLELLPRRFDMSTTNEIWDIIREKLMEDILKFLDREDKEEGEQNYYRRKEFESFVFSLKKELFETYGNKENIDELIQLFFEAKDDTEIAR